MKKLLFLLFTLLVAISVNSQTISYTGKLNVNVTFKDYTITNDTLTNADSIYIDTNIRSHRPFTFDVMYELEKISGSPVDTLFVQGQKFSENTWVDIANTDWTGTTTSVNVSHTTAVRYRKLRAFFKQTGTASTVVSDHKVKIYYE